MSEESGKSIYADTREERFAIARKLQDAAAACERGEFKGHLVKSRNARARAAVMVDRVAQCAGIQGLNWRPPWVPSVSEVSLRRRADALELCGRSPVKVVGWSSGQGGAVAAHGRCRDRLCPTCGKIAAAAIGAAMESVLKSEFDAGSRICFLTLTVRHRRGEKLRAVRKALDQAWARLIRRKLWRETVAEHHRAAEIEFTHAGGWHPHFHVVLKLRPHSRAWFLRRDHLEKEFVDAWRAITGKLGRDSFQVDLQEVKRAGGGNIERTYRDDAGAWVSIVEPVSSVVKELCKYVTKKQAGADAKRGQVGFMDYTGAMLAEYAAGIAHWNLHCSSAGWAKLTKAYEEADEKLELPADVEREETWEYSWAQVADMAERGAAHTLDAREVEEWASRVMLIVGALETEELRDYGVALRQYAAAFFGDLESDLPRLRVKPWQRKAWLKELSGLRLHQRLADEAEAAAEEKYGMFAGAVVGTGVGALEAGL